MKLPTAIAGAIILLLVSIAPFANGEPKAPIEKTPTKAELVKLIDDDRIDEVVQILDGLEARSRRKLLGAFDTEADVKRLYRVQQRMQRDKYLLQYKFTLGEVLRYQVKQATNLRTTMESTTQRNASQTESVKVWKVTDVLPSGNIEFVHLVESVRMSNEGSSQPKREFDSTSSEPPAPGFEAAARAIGVPLCVVQISPTGKVFSREQKLPQQAPPSEDMPITLELPEEAIAVGEKWSRSYDVAVTKASGAEIKIRTRRVCQLRQVTSGVAVIEVEYQILTPVDATIRSQIIDRLTKGTVRFDLKRGRVIQQSHEVDRREVGFTANSQASSMHLVARTTERLMDAKPAEVAQAPSAVHPASAEER